MEDMIRLIEPTIPSLRRYARSLVRDASEADDLVQDCLERAVSRWTQRRTNRDARSWMFAILHNLAVSRWRRLGRRGQAVTIDTVDEAALAAPATQQDGARHADVLKALDALVPDQRAVLLLVGVEDLSYADAAEVLGVPIGTVMSRLSRGRERLAQILAADTADSVHPHLRRIK
jgi:RNA polymerase sigma-70 factor (ECF subfamily)